MTRLQGQLHDLRHRVSDLERQNRSQAFCIADLKAGPSKFEAYDSAGLAAFTTAITIPLGTTRTDVRGELTLASDQVTIVTAGLYEVTLPTTVWTNTGSGAYVASSWLDKNSVELSGTRMYMGAPA